MRIIAGKYKGRQIYSGKDNSIRPTTNRIKEYIFGLLDEAVENAVVLDLFCGSGNLGLEAMSRGAKTVTFVDNSQKSLRVLRRNVNRLKVEEQYSIVKKDALEFLRKNSQPFDLILCDPPFEWNQYEELLPLAFKPENLSEYGLVVLESERSHEINWESDLFEVLRQKQFDRSLITILCRKNVV